MIRLLMFLLGKEYETCKSCATLREQLKVSNEEKERLTETLLDILQPKIQEAPVREIPNLRKPALTFTQRRRELEMQDRVTANARKSPLAAVPDDKIKNIPKSNEPIKPKSVEDLEKELGVADGNG